MQLTKRTSLGIAAASLAILATTGCASDSDSTTTTTEIEATTTSAAEAAVVEVRMVDFAFEGLPDEVEAGTSFTLVNESGSELHELVAIRLADDETRSVEEIMALPPEESMPLLGDVRTVLLAAPGSDEVIPAVGDGTLTEPGRYLIMCAIPTAADPQEYITAAATSDGPPEVDGGPPHFVHGMFGQVVVTG